MTGPFLGSHPVGVTGTPTHAGTYVVKFALTQPGRVDPATTTVNVTCPTDHTQLNDRTCQAPVCTQSLGTGQISTGQLQASGSWESRCVLPTGRRGSATYYAKHYTFSLPRPATVTIDLTSDDQDTYLFLIRGNNPNGILMISNDDHRSGDGTNIRNSRLPNRVLDAGVYTVSASTYRSERTGAFEVQLTACVANDVLLSRVCYPHLDPANGGSSFAHRLFKSVRLYLVSCSWKPISDENLRDELEL